MKHDVVLALRDLAIVASGLVAGGQVLILFALLPGLGRLPPLESFHFHQAVLSTDLPDRYIQPAGIASMAFGIALLALGPGSAAQIVLTVGGIGGIAVVAIVTRSVNRPINREVGTWNDDRAPEYPAIRARWARGHAVRTAFGMLAFCSYIVLASH